MSCSAPFSYPKGIGRLLSVLPNFFTYFFQNTCFKFTENNYFADKREADRGVAQDQYRGHCFFNSQVLEVQAAIFNFVGDKKHGGCEGQREY